MDSLGGFLRARLEFRFHLESILDGRNMYAGDADCTKAFDDLGSKAKSALVDVRTTREWETIGVPDLSELDKEVIFIEWQTFPTMEVNPAFADQVDVALQKQGSSKDDEVFFLCRTGVRSQAAAIALTQKGYSKAYNVTSGFEGAPDDTGERGKVNGWKSDGLPHKIPDKRNE